MLTVPVLQVPAGEAGGSGGLPNFLKEEEKGRRRGRRRMMTRRRRSRGRGGMRSICAGQPGGGGWHDNKIPLGPFCHLSPSPAEEVRIKNHFVVL